MYACGATPTSSIADKIAEESLKVLAKLEGQFMLQELASASRARDYINHLASNVSRESGYVEQMPLKENFKKLSEIEANIHTETWTVITNMDTTMLKTWLNEASKFQE